MQKFFMIVAFKLQVLKYQDMRLIWQDQKTDWIYLSIMVL
jgi:hypothetical protein